MNLSAGIASVAPTTSRSVLLSCRSKICFASGVASAASILPATRQGSVKRASAVRDRITVIGPPVYRFSSADARSRGGCYSAVLVANAKFVVRLYTQPASAMSDILDRGSLVFASVSVIVLSWLLGHTIRGLLLSFYSPLLILAAIYVPGVLAISGIAGRFAGGFGSVFQRDYAPLLTCIASAWVAANLPLLAIGWFWPQFFVYAIIIAYLYCAVLVFLAVRTVLGTGNTAAA